MDETAQSHSPETVTSHHVRLRRRSRGPAYEWGLPHHVRDLANLLIRAAIYPTCAERLLLLGRDGVEVSLDLLLAKQAT